MIRGIGWRRSIAAISACATMTLVGCGGDDEDPPDSGLPSDGKTTPTDSASPTSGSSPTPPSEPENIDNTSPAAAKAFARHVVNLFNYAKSTLDTKPLEAAFGAGCSVCASGIDNLQRLSRAGARIDGGLWEVEYLRYVPDRPPAEPLIDIVIRAGDERVVQPNQKADTNPGYQSGYLWHLRFSRGSGWSLVDWDDGD
jgi:hypothetical protein